MMMRFDNIVTLPSGNTARNFRVNDLAHTKKVNGVYMVDTRAIAHWIKELASY